MAQQSGHAARQFKKKENKLRAKEKKSIDAIIKDEEYEEEKEKGLLSSMMAPSVSQSRSHFVL